MDQTPQTNNNSNEVPEDHSPIHPMETENFQPTSIGNDEDIMEMEWEEPFVEEFWPQPICPNNSTVAVDPQPSTSRGGIRHAPPPPHNFYDSDSD